MFDLLFSGFKVLTSCSYLVLRVQRLDSAAVSRPPSWTQSLQPLTEPFSSLAEFTDSDTPTSCLSSHWSVSQHPNVIHVQLPT